MRQRNIVELLNTVEDVLVGEQFSVIKSFLLSSLNIKVSTPEEVNAQFQFLLWI